MADPATVTGLVNRWRASDLALANGAAVSTWAAATGGASWTQATGAAQPTFVTGVANGQPVVRFDGTSSYMTATVSAISQPYTAIVIYKALTVPTTNGVIMQLLDGGTVGTTTGFQLVYGNSGGPISDAWAGADTLGGTPNTTAFRVYGASFNGASSAVWMDGTAVVPAQNAGPNATGTAWAIGRQAASAARFANIDIAEILIYNRAMVAADWSVVDSYAQDTYGVTVADYVASGANLIADVVEVVSAGDRLPVLSPDGLTATVVSATQVRVSWSMLAGAVSYDLERNGSVIATGLLSTTYLDTGLTPGTAYTYNVRSVY